MSGPSRILILEDEPLIAMLLRDWMGDLGCEAVGPAHDVTDALMLIQRDTPDAAILDISLAAENCYPVADVLRARRVPYAFATGRAGSEIPPQHAGAPLILKPFVFKRVSEVITKILNARNDR
jgi:DNA-binding response OmpR family regulator